MGLKDGMNVLDVGCGVGGPAREMSRFAGVNVVGLNNNDYQIERATNYARLAGLGEKHVYHPLRTLQTSSLTADVLEICQGRLHADVV